MTKLWYSFLCLLLFLVSCNSGTQVGSTTNATGNLQAYFATLAYTPLYVKNISGEKLTSVPSNQQSFTLSQSIFFNSITVKFFTDRSCLSSSPTIESLTGGYTAQAGTYNTTNASLFYVCNTTMPGGTTCSNIYTTYGSIQYIFNFINPTDGVTSISNTTACMTNTSIADYSGGSPAACTSSTCEFRNSSYPTFAITNDLMLYYTPQTYNGNFMAAAQTVCSSQAGSICTSANITNGTIGADYLCNTESGMPSVNQAYYKAVIGDSTRTACTSANCVTGGLSENVNWVLYPNTQYQTTLVNPAFVTNSSAIYNFTTQGVFANPIFSSSGFYWTGIQNNWLTRGNLTSGACSSWTHGSSGGGGGEAILNSTSNSFIGTSNVTCANTLPILCAQN